MVDSNYKTDEYRKYHAEYAKKWYQKNKQKGKDAQKRYIKNNREKYREAQKESSLKKLYGITTKERDAIFLSQGSKCAICGSTNSGRKTHDFAIDHCHASGNIRGVLCHHCNALLGYAKDNVSILLAAVEYLKRNK